MSRASVLARGRRAAAAGMVDACEITRRVAGSQQTDPLDGTVTYQHAVIYTGKCEFQQQSAPWAGPATVGQAGLRLSALMLKLPVDGSDGVEVDDVVTCTASQHDTELVGRRFVVAGTHHASHKTARRLPLSEVLS